jgi:formate hydrogenlyase subunit 3/multisubunit Na+/H+ antiporter MnhD subunit
MSKSGYSTGAGRAAPLATAAALLGVLSLAGLPLTAGFPWRWILMAQSSESSNPGAILMVISMFATLWVVLRWTRVLFEKGSTVAEIELRTDGRVAVALMAGACLLLGILPQLVTPWVSLATAGLANLSP